MKKNNCIFVMLSRSGDNEYKQRPHAIGLLPVNVGFLLYGNLERHKKL